MKIGVISDTHVQIDNIRRAIKILNDEKLGLVIHCGDWVAPFTLHLYKELNCPIKGIFGNNDGDRFRHLKRATLLKLNIEYEERFLKLEVEGRKIAVFHGDYQEIVEALVTCNKYDAVFHGHTHIKINETVGKKLSLNPGILMNYTQPGVEGASFAIYDTSANIARLN